MPYSVSAGDVMEYTIDMRLNGQRCLNVYHWRYKVGSTTISDGGAKFLTWLAASVSDPTSVYECTRLAVSSDLMIVGHKMQVIYPTRKPATMYTTGTAGGRAGGALPTGVAACISLIQGTAGRSLNGRKEIPGLLSSDQVGDMWQPAVIGLLNDIGAAAIRDTALDLTTEVMEAILFKRATPISSQIVSSFSVRPQARYISRRTVGRGE